MADILDTLVRAMNVHDANAVASCFADDYRSVQPVHPSRDFVGRAQVLENWTSVFEGVPDFVAEVVASCDAEGRVWSEQRWSGTHRDGSPFLMQGVLVLGLREERIAWAHLFIEPVESGGGDIRVAVHELYRPATARGLTTGP